MNKTSNIKLTKKGKYRWTYDLSLLKNPTILFLLWKIFFWIDIGLYALGILFSLGNIHFWWEGFIDHTKFFAFFLLGTEVLVVLGYLLYTALMGGKYSVIFEMDEEGVTHAQSPKQFKKAQKMSILATTVGLLSGRPSVAMAGAVSGSRRKMITKFKDVKSCEVDRPRNVIKLDERLSSNQVYVSDADFDFVETFIKEHIK